MWTNKHPNWIEATYRNRIKHSKFDFSSFFILNIPTTFFFVTKSLGEPTNNLKKNDKFFFPIENIISISNQWY